MTLPDECRSTLAIIVNYKAAGLTLKAAASVCASASHGPVQVVVVDNSEDADEAAVLARSLPDGVQLIINPENMGFGRACNRVFEDFSDDCILLLNPDARLLPGCLERLQETLFQAQSTGAVSARVFWDDERRFLLPPSLPPELVFAQPFLAAALAHGTIRRLISGLWRRHAIRVWRSKRPLKASNLSGGLALLKRSAVQAAGGLFDPRFFLYFEDLDLFLRLKKAGYSLVIDPAAEAVHHYDQCDQRHIEQKRSLMTQSHGVFMEKYSANRLYRGAILLRKLMRPQDSAADRSGSTGFKAPFELEVPSSLRQSWLFEWSPNPDFIPAMGCFGRGPRMKFSETYWNLMAAGNYFGRLGPPHGSGRDALQFTWTVIK